ncbi:hypothetical protein AVEN_265878-1 [Araneus ventricosus]|uniref:Uncharacterized protein n=1 Tax=Araneus ventricosus TaxID=182803 RepID=A0A4Y2W3X1_ARAVE|nr:hypothetical protein AVEN_265878-1 [Araneus ventricosus]
MPKKKEEGMPPSRREAIRKRERRLLKAEEERSRRLSSMATTWSGQKSGRNQKNKEIVDCQTAGNRRPGEKAKERRTRQRKCDCHHAKMQENTPSKYY